MDGSYSWTCCRYHASLKRLMNRSSNSAWRYLKMCSAGVIPSCRWARACHALSGTFPSHPLQAQTAATISSAWQQAWSRAEKFSTYEQLSTTMMWRVTHIGLDRAKVTRPCFDTQSQLSLSMCPTWLITVERTNDSQQFIKLWNCKLIQPELPVGGVKVHLNWGRMGGGSQCYHRPFASISNWTVNERSFHQICLLEWKWMDV